MARDRAARCRRGPSAPPRRRSSLLTAALILAASLGATRSAASPPRRSLAVLGGGALVVAALLSPAVARVPGGWPLVAFVGLAVLTALSILWSINPADSWLEANRTIAYFAAFAGAAALATLARDRAARSRGGLLLGVTLVCGAALLSKIVPEWLNETERFARLREPFGYWNAVGLAGALAAPLALWLGARRQGAPALSALAYPALTLALTTMLLAYSRGSLLAAPSASRRGSSSSPPAACAAPRSCCSAPPPRVRRRVDLRPERADRGPRSSSPSAAPPGASCSSACSRSCCSSTSRASSSAFLGDLRPLDLRQRRGLGAALLVGVALIPVAIAGVLSTTDEGLGGSISTAWKTITDPKAEPPRPTSRAA